MFTECIYYFYALVFSLATKKQLADELRHMPEMLMDNSAMTPLLNQEENLSLDLPLPALLRRLV